jgi:hypothetical protein
MCFAELKNSIENRRTGQITATGCERVILKSVVILSKEPGLMTAAAAGGQFFNWSFIEF